jgi:hypothetical protein
MCLPLHAQFSNASQQSGQAQNDALLRGFVDPPNGARPRVWWHWMDGNISEQGIKLDLDWMHRLGLAASQSSRAPSTLRRSFHIV